LTPQHWLSAGITGILKARLWAAGLNLQTFFAVQSSIVLAPLILLGLWRLRLDRRVQVGVLAWLLTFFVMTLVFPYQGARGGFFHSGAALQPLFWAVAPLGLCALIDWAGRLRGWNLPQARLVFGVSLVGLVVLLTIVLAFRRVGLGNEAQSAWNQDITRYVHLEQYLESQGAQPSEGVLVNNSPGFFIASERPSISIPYGDVQTVLEVARRYQARYLLLEFNQLTGVDDLYANPGDRPGLNYMATIEGVRVYQIIAFPLSMQAGLWRK